METHTKRSEKLKHTAAPEQKYNETLRETQTHRSSREKHALQLRDKHTAAPGRNTSTLNLHREREKHTLQL